MVVTVALHDSPQALGEYFSTLAKATYHTEGGEPPGRWIGTAAAALGLHGTVTTEALIHVLSGRRADGTRIDNSHKQAKKRSGKRPSKIDLLKKGKKEICAVELCFNPPKDYSALRAVLGDSVLEDVSDWAAKSTIDWFCSNIPLVRRGKGGHTKLLAEPVVAQFDHATSRVAEKGSWEPQFHRHYLFARYARGEDGRWTAIDTRPFHEWARVLGPMFRATLAQGLIDRLGLQLTPARSKDGRSSWFEIQGVPRALCDAWSSRRGEIEALLAATPAIGQAADAHAREAANLLTRRAKPEVPPRAELRSQWQAEASEFGLTPAAIQKLLGHARQHDPELVFQKAWKQTISQLDVAQSTFSFRDALQRICEACQTQGVAGTWLADRLQSHLNQSQEIHPIGIVAGEERYVTNKTRKMEQELLQQFENLRSANGARVTSTGIQQALASHKELLPEQREAVDEILSGKGALRVLIGVAGAGKSHTLNAVREAYEAAGYRVLGGAIAGTAKEELAAKAGIESRTVASHLHRISSRNANDKERVVSNVARIVQAAFGERRAEAKHELEQTVLILDEAGMIDSPTLLPVCKAVSKHDATLILVGDTAQLQPIGSGGPLLHLTRSMAVTRLSTNLRQHDSDDRLAAKLLREGDADKALQGLAERGRISVADNRAEALKDLIDSWSLHGGGQSPERHVIFTATRAEAKAANRLAQRERAAHGHVDVDDRLNNGDETICRGDRILFHKNVFADGIRNGYRGEIISVDPCRDSLAIRLDGRKPKEVNIKLSNYGPDGITLGYAQTTHKGQGQTVDYAYLLVGGRMADREMSYVQATRARFATRLFVDKAHAGENLEDLAKAFSRSRTKELAHDVALRARKVCANSALESSF